MAVKPIFFKNHKFEISYNLVLNNASKNMIFVHGWGSNKELMQLAFKESFKDFNHIYIDLPGFGASENSIFLDTFDYAQIVNIFLKNIIINNVCDANVIVGHSYGGKIALLLNREIILLSSAGILLEKSPGVKLKIKLAKIAKMLNLNLNFLRASDAKSLSPVMYEIFKHIVNEDFSKYYKDFACRATVFWGDKDAATPVESYEIIKKLMSKANFFLMDGDHYFFLKQGKKIQELYESSKGLNENL